MNTTSLSLLEGAARKGSSSSWDRLVDVYVPLLQCWLERFHVQDADADDLIQEVLAVVARELPDFQHNQRKGAFRKWLRTVLTHRLREFWRTAKALQQNNLTIWRHLQESDSRWISVVARRWHDDSRGA